MKTTKWFILTNDVITNPLISDYYDRNSVLKNASKYIFYIIHWIMQWRNIGYYVSLRNLRMRCRHITTSFNIIIMYNIIIKLFIANDKIMCNYLKYYYTTLQEQCLSHSVNNYRFIDGFHSKLMTHKYRLAYYHDIIL